MPDKNEATKSDSAGDPIPGTTDASEEDAETDLNELQTAAEMTAFVQTLLEQMQSNFQAMSENIIAKIDDMGSRLEELEVSVTDLMKEAEAGSQTKAASSGSAGTPTKAGKHSTSSELGK